MMTGTNRGSSLGLLRWQWRNAVLYAMGGTVGWLAWYVLEVRYGLLDINLPALPLGIVGGALGIFVSFRVNASYDRWWEGRKLWGRLINTSRHWANQVTGYITEPRLARRLVERHMAYVHVLRCLLRNQDPLDDAGCLAHLTDDEQAAFPDESNPTNYLLHQQFHDLHGLTTVDQLDGLRLQSLDETLRALLDIQGGCERIKNTPVPPGYGFIAELLIRYFAFLLPLALVDHVSFWVIPITVLVCLSFMLINEAGRVLENPFSLFWNGLPLQNLSDTIEHNLRNRLGEAESTIEPIPGPDENGILM